MRRSVLICLIPMVFFGYAGYAQPDKAPVPGNWTKGTPDRFSGVVWVEYFVNDTANDFLSSRVLFTPSARSNWHYHQGRQIIFAIDGEGYYKEKGKPLRILKKGDLVSIDPGTIHSHGSMGRRFLQGVMMNGIRNARESTTWLDPLKDADLQ